MQRQKHPTLSVLLQKLFIKLWLLIGGSLAAAFVLIKSGFPTYGKALLFITAASVIAIIFYFRYRLHHVSCPNCGQACRTHKDKNNRKWVALCKSCDTLWLLNIGSEN